MTVALVVARALHFWALAVLFGGGGLLLLLKRREPGIAVRCAAVLALASGVAWLALTFVGVTGDPADLARLDAWRGVLASPFGPPWAIQLAILAACGIAAAQRRLAPFVAIGLAAILDQAWLGHAATGTGATAATMIASYWVHVLAGSAWVGGLTMLCLLIARRDRDLARAGVSLFSTSGIVLVAAILASGVLNGSFRIATASDLVATPYGRIVAIKVGLFMAMIGSAIFNRRQGVTWSRRLAFSIALETTCGLAVLLAAAILGITEPPS